MLLLSQFGGFDCDSLCIAHGNAPSMLWNHRSQPVHHFLTLRLSCEDFLPAVCDFCPLASLLELLHSHSG